MKGIKGKKIKKKHITHASKILFWFLTGTLLGFFLLISFAYIIFQKTYNNKVYPGVTIQNTNFGGKTQSDVQAYYWQKNNAIKDTTFVFKSNDTVATISASKIDLGYDTNLISQQAISVGRSQDIFSNIATVTNAYY